MGEGSVYGRVPPPVVRTASGCPNGVARVDTQHSFLNALVGGATFGIVTPMHITVSCASGAAGAEAGATTTPTVPKDASTEERADAVNAAGKLSAATGAPRGRPVLMRRTAGAGLSPSPTRVEPEPPRLYLLGISVFRGAATGPLNATPP